MDDRNEEPMSSEPPNSWSSNRETAHWWSTLATIVGVAIALATFLFIIINDIGDDIKDNSTKIDRAVSDIRAEIREDRRDLDEDIDRLGDLLIENIVQLNRVVERASAQAHVHTSPVGTAPPPPPEAE